MPWTPTNPMEQAKKTTPKRSVLAIMVKMRFLQSRLMDKRALAPRGAKCCSATLSASKP